MLLLEADAGRKSPIRTAVLLSSAALLALSASSQSSAQRTTYDVIVQRDVMVSMRDGVKLATDVYLPALCTLVCSNG
jgi:predicted acyl esterase